MVCSRACCARDSTDGVCVCWATVRCAPTLPPPGAWFATLGVWRLPCCLTVYADTDTERVFGDGAAGVACLSGVCWKGERALSE
eukprot:1538170-Rhodomonas_salina.1